MKRLTLAALVIGFVFLCGTAKPCLAGYKMEINDYTKAEIGFWMQGWYQRVEDGKDGADLNDFILRRAYLYLKGQVTDYFGVFTHIASDKIGAEGLDKSGLGLGTGVAWRDLWASLILHESFKVQIGRMYVPLTRAYGTTSTKCMLTLDLPFLQGGSRGKIFYAQKVGRDDSVVIWGTTPDELLPWGTNLQYRLMIGEGVEGDANPDDKLRVAGRLSLSLLDAERGWFNKGSYLGKKRVLSIGGGVDSQNGLTLNEIEDQDSLAWTVDCFFDHPIGNGAVTVEAAYIDISKGTVTQKEMYTDLAAGDDASNWYVNGGYLINDVGPGGLQPYFRYETVDVDMKHKTHFISGGINYIIKGHNAKVTLDYMHVDPKNPEKDSRGIFTFQGAVGF